MKKVLGLFAVVALLASCNSATEAVKAGVDSAKNAATETVNTVVDSAKTMVDSTKTAIVDSAKAKGAQMIEAGKEKAMDAVKH